VAVSLGERPPAVALAEQHNEVRLDTGLLAALNFAQADFHGLLVESLLVTYAPSQVNGLEEGTILLAELAQLWEHDALQSVTLGLQVSSKVELTNTRNVRVVVGIWLALENSLPTMRGSGCI
jgi:hypothetical protein